MDVCWVDVQASIPHLTQLAKKYTNVMFVGVSSEPESKAKPFVDRMGAQMDYIVAVDAAGSVQEKLAEPNGVSAFDWILVSLTNLMLLGPRNPTRLFV